MQERKAFKVSGKVQGVYYRASTQTKALELALSGFVRNEPDGTVYLEAQGSPTALQLLENWLYQGPPSSKVTKVQTSVLPLQETTAVFEIHR